MGNNYVELSQSELRQIDGGSILGPIIAGLIIAAGTQILKDWDNFKNGLAGRPEQK